MDIGSVNYYEILGILPQATKPEIKTAYYKISKELHPDKLPLDTPELARSILSEKYKKITEAYSCLIDPDKRREYDQQFEPHQHGNYYSDNNRQDNVNYQDNHSEVWFDENQIRWAAENLKIKLDQIERDAEQRYTYQINFIEQELLTAVKQINYKGSIDALPSIADKGQSITSGIIWIIVGFIVLYIRNYILGLLGIIFMSIGFLKIIYGCQMPLNRHKKILKAKSLYQNFVDKKLRYLQQKDEEILQEKNLIKSRIQNFQAIPISTITRDFFRSLSSEDQLLLLVAIHENKNQLNTEEQEMVKVALGIGAAAVLLGLMGLMGL